jgi:hypothetical protein
MGRIGGFSSFGVKSKKKERSKISTNNLNYSVKKIYKWKNRRKFFTPPEISATLHAGRQSAD